MITSKQYAIALYGAAKNKKGLEEKLKNFILVLKKNRQLNLAPQIIKEFEKYEYSQKGIEKTEIISAKKIDSQIINRLKDLISKMTGKKILVQEKEDKNLISGVIIRWQDYLIDLSARRQLEQLKDIFKN